MVTQSLRKRLRTWFWAPMKKIGRRRRGRKSSASPSSAPAPFWPVASGRTSTAATTWPSIAFNRPADGGYQPFLDFNGNGIINTVEDSDLTKNATESRDLQMSTVKISR